MDLDVFLSEQNIRRFRRLLQSSVTPTERKTIFKLPQIGDAPPNADWLSIRQHHQLSNELLRSPSPTPPERPSGPGRPRPQVPPRPGPSHSSLSDTDRPTLAYPPSQLPQGK